MARTITATFIIVVCISNSLGQYDMNNLGDNIQQQVHDGLKPVRIMQNTFRVKFGQQGTTVANYHPSEKTLIIKEARIYVCDGSISDNDGSCSNTLKSLDYKQDEDFCYSITRTQINDQICVGSTGGISSNTVNGKFNCKGTDGSRVLLMKTKDFEKLCAKVADSVSYKYFTKQNMVDVGNGLACSGDNPQVCTYRESLLNFSKQSSATRIGSIFSVVPSLLLLIFLMSL